MAEPTGGGGSGFFSEDRFVEKLDRLNNSATSIETLSNWCMFHQKRAKRVVDIWERQFYSATSGKKISLLYLSNDILQKSRIKGVEFVKEFWKVLPGLLKDFYENEREDGKKVVERLIEIWDERKVFGTCNENLKYILPPAMDNNGTSSNPTSSPSSNTKAAWKDSSTIIKKLTIGGMPEKIVTAYQYVLDQQCDEDTSLNKCKTSLSVFEKINKDVDAACSNGLDNKKETERIYQLMNYILSPSGNKCLKNLSPSYLLGERFLRHLFPDRDIQQVSSLIFNLQKEEAILKQCIEQLEGVHTARITLINQLKEALSEQETKSDLLCNQLQVARAEAENAMQLRQRLGACASIGPGSGTSTLTTHPSEQTAAMMQNAAMRPISPQFQPPHPATSLPTTAGAADDEPKKTAAAIADKLASLSSAEQVLSSIFASFAAEQAASMSSASPSGGLSEGLPGIHVQKKPRLENPMQTNAMGAPGIFGQLAPVQQQIRAPPTSRGGTHPSTRTYQAPGSFTAPLPPLAPSRPPFLQQFSQIPGGTFGMGPYQMMSGSMTAPHPRPNSLPPGFQRPSRPPLPPPARNQRHPQQQS